MNNSNSSTMFAHIVSRLTNRTEDVAVEALGFILSRSYATRRALRDLLQLEGMDVGELTGAETQVSDETLARPDLVVLGEDREERVLIEAKFWANLTDNQPNAYLARLPLDEHPSVLLFIAPEARVETLWPELRRLIEPPFDWQLIDTSEDMDIKCAMVDEGTRFLMLTSWRVLLRRMLSFAMSSGDSVETDIRQLYALCEQQDQDAFLPIKPHELAPEIPRRMLQFNQLVDDVVERARERGVVSTDGVNRQPQSYGYGRYVYLGSQDADVWAGAWFGIDYTLWAQHQDTPIWLTFSDWEGVITVEELRRKFDADVWANTDSSIPVHLPVVVDYHKVLHDAVERLAEIAKVIAS